jgi:hypothetical protein
VAIDRDEVRAGLDGGVFVAPVGTPLPADPTDALDAAFVNLGYLNDDGVSMNPSQDREDITAWQSIVPVRRVLTGSQFQLSFTMIQTSRDTVTLAFPGATVETNTGIHKITIPANPGSDERCFIFDWMDGAIHNRVIIERGEVTDISEIQIHRSDPVAYEVTLDSYPNDDNEIAVWLSDDPALAA